MQTNKKILPFLILSALAFLLAGCHAIQKPDVALEPDSAKNNNASMSKRFQDAAPQSQTAVDSAVEMSKKNAELFEQMAVLQQENQKLIAENRQLRNRLGMLEPELRQTKKELNEANDLLIDMTTEINNWKVDVLGNREEMRQANIAQMEILLKIAEAMGAEITAQQDQNKQSTETSGGSNG
ncbi:MAG: hypothetical protein WC476_04915 [Phycisphaerae bacterium]